MTYDLVTVGGGLGGAALAGALAARGARTLVIERERRFQDRVRGEVLMPWGAGEARALGLYDLLAASCGHALRWDDLFVAGVHVAHRDLPATTPQAAPWLAFSHPAMQEVVLAAAAAAGAEVWRGARARGVTPGARPAVEVERDGHTERVTARLVVGADGRSSLVRKWAGFEVRRDPERILFSGVLFDDLPAAEDAGRLAFHPDRGRLALLFPQGGGRVRAYVSYHTAADPPRGKESDLARFIAESVRSGLEPELFARARPAGPLATFDATDTWVDHPYQGGVALVGDAAATSDPTWGQGMSITLRDVRTLRDRLLATDDWDAAAHAYAADHDRDYGVIHAVEQWYTDVFLDVGPAAEARRARALPQLAADDSRLPDALISGPEVPTDDGVRRRFFGEE